MTAALRTVLAKAGLRVDPDEFLTLVEDAARQLTPADPDPAAYFDAASRRALTDAGLDLSPAGSGEPDHRARTVAALAVLRDSALNAADAARTVGVDTSRIRHRLLSRKLAGWKERGGWRLPTWQFTRTGVLPGLETVLGSVPPDQPALVVAAFMTTPQPDLVLDGAPATPRQWLLAGGDPGPVARLASALGAPA
ncbi:MAG TPA: DNA-binding protein [Actinophytocola sp.]|uniref:DNA-binding protein n=1 Tax=Actinophytocola sp. TaxID=1872138 RepID=UPI002DBEF83B|nr:DNA-binding protein [Actinophytocola sp.]HEU5475206.1 DNA-binding protein [Actinophytocola sp.]